MEKAVSLAHVYKDHYRSFIPIYVFGLYVAFNSVFQHHQRVSTEVHPLRLDCKGRPKVCHMDTCNIRHLQNVLFIDTTSATSNNIWTRC